LARMILDREYFGQFVHIVTYALWGGQTRQRVYTTLGQDRAHVYNVHCGDAETILLILHVSVPLQ
jgi:hypothetical protein